MEIYKETQKLITLCKNTVVSEVIHFMSILNLKLGFHLTEIIGWIDGDPQLAGAILLLHQSISFYLTNFV